MEFAFGPDGFDDEKKRRAEEAEEALSTASAVFGLLAAGATFVFPPLVGGLALAAAVGPVLGLSLQRMKKDPPRLDFYEAASVAPPLDPTAVIGQDGFEADNYVGLLAALVAYPVAADRTAAHMGAMVTAVERAMGAYAARSTAAVDLRVAEANAHAQRALSSATALRSTTTVLSGFIPLIFEDPKTIAEQLDEEMTTFDELLEGATAARLLSAGVSEAFLMQPVVTNRIRLEASDEHTLDVAGDAIYQLMDQLTDDLPPTVKEFIASQEDVPAGAGA